MDQTEDFQRGQILRCKGKYPYEDVVDFMIIEDIPHGQPRNPVLLVVSGHKAGLTLVRLPDEALPEGLLSGIDLDWLKQNWHKWIYPECPLEDVYLVDHPEPAWPG
jgi:hypothetical protein